MGWRSYRPNHAGQASCCASYFTFLSIEHELFLLGSWVLVGNCGPGLLRQTFPSALLGVVHEGLGTELTKDTLTGEKAGDID